MMRIKQLALLTQCSRFLRTALLGHICPNPRCRGLLQAPALTKAARSRRRKLLSPSSPRNRRHDETRCNLQNPRPRPPRSASVFSPMFQRARARASPATRPPGRLACGGGWGLGAAGDWRLLLGNGSHLATATVTALTMTVVADAAAAAAAATPRTAYAAPAARRVASAATPRSAYAAHAAYAA